MTDLVIGVDIGGTKVQVCVSSPTAIIVNEVRASRDWGTHPWAGGAQWIADQLDAIYPSWREVACLAVGANGCDSPGQIAALKSGLDRLVPFDCIVVNDAELVVPAAGLHDGIGVIVGTGSIAAGVTRQGVHLTAGGWGWTLGDEGSAPTLVREAIRRVLTRYEQGHSIDRLGAELLASFEVATLAELLVTASANSGRQEWGKHAPAVFRAANEGSAEALDVIRSGAESLADLVERLDGRGVPANHVVVAGGVIRNQPLLATTFEAAIQRRLPNAAVHLLHQAPVRGALVMAWNQVGWSGTVPAVQVLETHAGPMSNASVRAGG